jgi:hypothetical protein
VWIGSKYSSVIKFFVDALLGDCPPANCQDGQFFFGNQPRLIFGVLIRDPLYAGTSACTTPPEARGLMARGTAKGLCSSHERRIAATLNSQAITQQVALSESVFGSKLSLSSSFGHSVNGSSQGSAP